MSTGQIVAGFIAGTACVAVFVGYCLAAGTLLSLIPFGRIIDRKIDHARVKGCLIIAAGFLALDWATRSQPLGVAGWAIVVPSGVVALTVTCVTVARVERRIVNRRAHELLIRAGVIPTAAGRCEPERRVPPSEQP